MKCHNTTRHQTHLKTGWNKFNLPKANITDTTTEICMLHIFLLRITVKWSGSFFSSLLNVQNQVFGWLFDCLTVWLIPNDYLKRFDTNWRIPDMRIQCRCNRKTNSVRLSRFHYIWSFLIIFCSLFCVTRQQINQNYCSMSRTIFSLQLLMFVPYLFKCKKKLSNLWTFLAPFSITIFLREFYQLVLLFSGIPFRDRAPLYRIFGSFSS